MKKKRLIIAALALVITLIMPGPATARANSAAVSTRLINALGQSFTVSSTPIVVEKELLTLNIPELGLASVSTVTAEYSLYNPSDSVATTKLMFPIGPNERSSDVLAEGYDILLDGQPVEKAVRFSARWGFDDFNLERDLARLSDQPISDGIFAPDTAVRHYTYEVSGVDFGSVDAAYAALEIDSGDSGRALYLVGNQGSKANVGQGIGVHVKDNHQLIDLYVMGSPYGTAPAFTLYSDDPLSGGSQIGGAVALQTSSDTTLWQFALHFRDGESAVSDLDWYNAVVAELCDEREYSAANDHVNTVIVRPYLSERGFPGELMRWYEYEITLGPGERAVNSVTAPIYQERVYDPTGNSARNQVTYYLSPAKTWSEFGELEIKIITPYILRNDCSFEMHKIDGGFGATLDGLPEGELRFSLYTTSDYYGEGSDIIEDEKKTVGLVIFYTAISVLFAGVSVVSLTVHKKRKNRQ